MRTALLLRKDKCVLLYNFKQVHMPPTHVTMETTAFKRGNNPIHNVWVLPFVSPAYCPMSINKVFNIVQVSDWHIFDLQAWRTIRVFQSCPSISHIVRTLRFIIEIRKLSVFVHFFLCELSAISNFCPFWEKGGR